MKRNKRKNNLLGTMAEKYVQSCEELSAPAFPPFLSSSLPSLYFFLCYFLLLNSG